MSLFRCASRERLRRLCDPAKQQAAVIRLSVQSERQGVLRRRRLSAPFSEEPQVDRALEFLHVETAV